MTDMKNKSAVLPGSYDPITKGHLEIIKRAAEQFGTVHVVAFINPDKKYTFSAEERVKMLALATEGLGNVTVGFSEGYVVDYMREHGIDKIVKGYRNETDLEYERVQAKYNFEHGGYETELWLSDERFKEISSTRVRALIAEGGDLSEFLPENVISFINNH